MSTSDATPPTVLLKLNTPRLLGDSGYSIELKDYTVEEIAASPQDAEAYPAGSGVVMHVLIGGELLDFSDLSAGYDSHRVRWSSNFRVTLVDHDEREPSVQLQVEHISDRSQAELFADVKVKKGESLDLGEGLRFRFEGHSHKRVYAGQESPLMVYVSYLQEQQSLESTSYNLYPPRHKTWRFRNYEFDLIEHLYDDSMVLKVKRLALKNMVLAAVPETQSRLPPP